MNNSPQIIRDERGRFLKGYSGNFKGRPKKTYSWFTEWKFRAKYPFLQVPYPDKCPDCGEQEYRFNLRLDNKNSNIIRCKCNNCNNERQYLIFVNQWSKP